MVKASKPDVPKKGKALAEYLKLINTVNATVKIANARNKNLTVESAFVLMLITAAIAPGPAKSGMANGVKEISFLVRPSVFDSADRLGFSMELSNI